MTIQSAIAAVLEKHPEASNAQVALAVQQMVPGATTTAASVASVKSRMRASSNVTPLSVDGIALPGPLSPVNLLEESDLPEETDEERDARIRSRYAAFERMARRVVEGKTKSLIVSGAPGLGKSYTIMRAIEEAGVEHEAVSGSISAVGLYVALWNTREEGQLLVLDDADGVFDDPEALNLLKAVLDTNGRRRVSWRKAASWLGEQGIEPAFDYRGAVVFLSNVDFQRRIARGNAIGKHLEALVDRSFYLSLSVYSRKDVLCRIRQVASGEDGILASRGLGDQEAADVLGFVAEHLDRFHSVSIRLVIQVAELRVSDPEHWAELARLGKVK